MDLVAKSFVENLEAEEKGIQFEASNNILAATKKVDWAYEIWKVGLVGKKQKRNGDGSYD